MSTTCDDRQFYPPRSQGYNQTAVQNQSGGARNGASRAAKVLGTRHLTAAIRPAPHYLVGDLVQRGIGYATCQQGLCDGPQAAGGLPQTVGTAGLSCHICWAGTLSAIGQGTLSARRFFFIHSYRFLVLG